MKNFYGLDCGAKGYDQLSMSIQAKLTAIVVNLKRVAKILTSLKGQNSDSLSFIYHITEKMMALEN